MTTPGDDSFGPNLQSNVECHPFGSIKWHTRSPLFAAPQDKGEAPLKNSVSNSLSKEASMLIDTSAITAFTSACSNLENGSVDDSGMAPSACFETGELPVFDEVDLKENQDICEFAKVNHEDGQPLFPENSTVITSWHAPSAERPSPSLYPVSARIKALTALAAASTEAFTVHPMERLTPQRPFNTGMQTQEASQPKADVLILQEDIVAPGLPEDKPRREVEPGTTTKIETRPMLQSFEEEHLAVGEGEHGDAQGKNELSGTEDSVDSEEIMAKRRLHSPVLKELPNDEVRERQAMRIHALEEIITNLQLELEKERQRAQEEEERAADTAVINAELAGELAALREALAANEADIENFSIQGENCLLNPRGGVYSGGKTASGLHSTAPRVSSPTRRSCPISTSDNDMRRSINSGSQLRDTAFPKRETRKSPGEVRRSTEVDSEGRGFAPLFAGTLNLRKSVSQATGRQ